MSKYIGLFTTQEEYNASKLDYPKLYEKRGILIGSSLSWPCKVITVISHPHLILREHFGHKNNCRQS